MKNIPIKKPYLTEIDYQKVRFHRGLLTHPKELKDFGLRKTGDEGEVKLIDILYLFLPDNWQVLRNIWLDSGTGKTEVDILVITPKFWWVLEAKNYTGIFEYRQDECFVNQKPIQNQVAACRNRLRIVKDVARQAHGYIPDVYASIIFINEKCIVKTEPLNDISILMNYQIPWHIQEMVNRNDNLPDYIQLDNSIALLEKYEISNPYLPKIISPDDFNAATKGIQCYRCNSYDVQIRHRYVVCRKCYHSFSKTEAILQASCELSVLLYTDPKIITVGNVYNFTAGQVNKRGIRQILKKHLPRYGFRKGAYYLNGGLPYERMKDHFIKCDSTS